MLRNLHILAESTQRLSSALKSSHPKVDWRGIAGFRNVLVHDYLGVDLAGIWEVVEQPALHWYEAHGIGRKDIKIKRYVERDDE